MAGEALGRQHISPQEKQTLVNFVHARPNMQTGKLTPTYTKAISNSLWEQITAILNAIPGGAIKTAAQWNKTWRDLKKTVKSKAAKEKKIRDCTGGGPPPNIPDLVDKTTENKILEIITPISVEGHREVPDPFILAQMEINSDINEMVCDAEFLEKDVESLPTSGVQEQEEPQFKPQCSKSTLKGTLKGT